MSASVRRESLLEIAEVDSFHLDDVAWPAGVLHRRDKLSKADFTIIRYEVREEMSKRRPSQ